MPYESCEIVDNQNINVKHDFSHSFCSIIPFASISHDNLRMLWCMNLLSWISVATIPYQRRLSFQQIETITEKPQLDTT